MFREFKCGCIVSEFQGRVRICDKHRLSKADGYGGLGSSRLRGVDRTYPANGEMPARWSGR